MGLAPAALSSISCHRRRQRCYRHRTGHDANGKEHPNDDRHPSFHAALPLYLKKVLPTQEKRNVALRARDENRAQDCNVCFTLVAANFEPCRSDRREAFRRRDFVSFPGAT